MTVQPRSLAERSTDVTEGRLARIVVPGIPHHVTQRGNRRQEVFFAEADYRIYLELLAAFSQAAGTRVLAYCLMPNHVHLILLPADEAGLRGAVQETHRRYTRYVNRREDWRGYLWQGRFASFPMDQPHLLMAARYIELNPLRARLAGWAADYPWSSARAHLAGRDDGLVKVAPLLALVDDWAELLGAGPDEVAAETLRRHARNGRPLGDAGFVSALEARLGRAFAPRKRGPKSGPRIPN